MIKSKKSNHSSLYLSDESSILPNQQKENFSPIKQRNIDNQWNIMSIKNIISKFIYILKNYI